MRRWLAAGCHGLAWCALVTALPAIWAAGFLRGLALSLQTPPVTHDDGTRWTRAAVLSDVDTASILGAHERAMRRGEARWQ